MRCNTMDYTVIVVVIFVCANRADKKGVAAVIHGQNRRGIASAAGYFHKAKIIIVHYSLQHAVHFLLLRELIFRKRF